MASKSARNVEDRRARSAELRRKQKAQDSRRKVFLYGGSFVVMVVVIVGLVLAATHKTSTSSSGHQVLPLAITSGVTTVQRSPAMVPDSSGISGVVAYDSSGYPSGKADGKAMSHDHVLGPVTYAVTPPVGGPHNAVWMNCGVYTKSVPNERAVHNLEHGAVWITYRPSLSATDVKALESLVLKQSRIAFGSRFMDLTPWATEDLSSPIVINAWAHQLKVESPSDPRLQPFIDAFRHKDGITPEIASPCDGQPVDVGGRPSQS